MKRLIVGCAFGLLLKVSTLLALPVNSFNERPWIDHPLRLAVTLDPYFERFNKIDDFCYQGNSLLIDGKIPFAITSDWDFFLGTRFGTTHKVDFAVDHFSEGVRYAFYDDARGDYFALATGLELRQVLRLSLQDPSIFYHGLFETVASLSIGKEWISEADWIYRVFGSVGIGAAESSAFWGFATGGFKYCFSEMNCLTVFGQFESGFGKKKIDLCSFRGYGDIQYRALDVGAAYSFESDYGVILTTSLYKRVYSKNAPKNLIGTSFNIEYPFSL